jgi:mono/diheme cytochrome c family protein
MPVWGSILTAEQLSALVDYTYQASQGTSPQAGQELFAKNCSACHGQFGEGGPNPTKPGSTITPITTSEFLKTRDDATLRAIITQGLPDSGMSPFGSTNGGQLDDTQIDTIVAYLRSWESKPLETLPPQPTPTTVAPPTLSPKSGETIFAGLCAQCHGPKGEGVDGMGPALNEAEFQQDTDQQITDTINNGVQDTTMPAWSGILSSDQIDQVVKFIRSFGGGTSSELSGPPTFAKDVLPLLQNKCGICHGSAGGWSADDYKSITKAVVPGDADKSVLAQRLLGKSEGIMPPSGKLSDAEIKIVLDWIMAGSPDN